MNFAKIKDQAVHVLESEAKQFALRMLESAKQAGRDRVYDVIGGDSRQARDSHLFRSILTFGAGVSVGAGLALLLTPMNGRETRDAILELVTKLIPGAKGRLESPAVKSEGADAGSPFANAKADADEAADVAAHAQPGHRTSPPTRGEHGHGEHDGVTKDTVQA